MKNLKLECRVLKKDYEEKKKWMNISKTCEMKKQKHFMKISQKQQKKA